MEVEESGMTDSQQVVMLGMEDQDIDQCHEHMAVVTDMSLQDGAQQLTMMTSMGSEAVGMSLQEGDTVAVLQDVDDGSMVTEVVMEDSGILGTEEVVLGSEDDHVVMMDPEEVTLGKLSSLQFPRMHRPAYNIPHMVGYNRVSSLCF